MSEKKKRIYPYIPNSVPKIKEEMLKIIGVDSIEDLYEDIPDHLKFKGTMDLPEPLVSEQDLKKHVEKILAKNVSCGENINFLGGGCAQHYVPVIVDEIVSRSEFLTAYAGEPYEDHGRFQALFEYESLMAELLDFDVVNVPTFDWTQAASTSIRMAGRLTKRDEILISDTVSPDRLSAIKNYVIPAMKVSLIKHNSITGQLDIKDLKSKMNGNVAGVYFENPTYLGLIEEHGQEISDIAHNNGGLSIVGVDPASLGVLKPPSNYGADIACGDIQSLGLHLYFGGALGGFISSRDEEKIIMEYPSRLFGITKTEVEGEWGFDDVAYDRTSFAEREKGKEFVGTAAALWGIAAGVYLSLMGPDGMKELGKNIIQKTRYAMKKLSEIKGVKIKFASSFFKEFVVDFSGTGKDVAYINNFLLENNIFGGKDLSDEFPEFNNCSLFCVTEVISQEDIDKLISVLKMNL